MTAGYDRLGQEEEGAEHAVESGQEVVEVPGRLREQSSEVGAYVARYMARNVVAAGLARRCEIQISYGVGEEQPLAVTVETFGTGAVPDERIERVLDGLVDLRPAAVVEAFGLRALPEQHGGEFYRALAAYGQVGRADLDAPWEREDLAAGLRRAAGHKG